MTERPSVVCIVGESWWLGACGRAGGPLTTYLLDRAHAEACIEKQSRLVPCEACMVATAPAPTEPAA